MAQRGDEMGGEQWSWWESAPDQPPTDHPPTAVQPPVDEQGNRVLHVALLGIVVVLALTLAVVSYQRLLRTESSAGATATTTTMPEETTTEAPADSTTGPSTTTTAPTTGPSTTPPAAGSPPAPPANVTLVEIGPNTARIEWTSEACVGSRYQVGEFAEGGGGYPNVDRCWTDHVVLAGDPSFSPLLEPDTEYVVRIHAVGPDGQLSEPRFITIRTPPG